MKCCQFILYLLVFLQGSAQDLPANSLKSFLQLAEKNYPLLKSKALDVEAAQKGIDISKSTIIPSLDASYQLNYASFNNITGMAYPQFLIPISGPPSASNSMSGVFGSATSLLLNWQPVTFGQRQSQTDFANAGLQYANADAANQIFRHKVNVINAYLDVLTATELVKVFEENLKRTEAGFAMVRTLVINGIRPGVDSGLLKSEVSKAKIELLNSRKNKEQTLIGFTQLLVVDSIPAFDDSSYFNNLPSSYVIADSLKNPLLSLYTSSIELSNARKKVISKTTMPTLGVWSTVYARGSGVESNGPVKATDGLGFQRFNYGVGVQLSVPILQFARIKPQLQQQDLIIRSNKEKLNDISWQLKKQNELAETTLNSALDIVKEMPLFYESAAFSYRALLSRYQSGLANFADLIQAQYALIKAETDQKLAYMGVWKAFLYKAAVDGNINLFINQVK
ncbi:MAG TPA: TolC family protein [Flavitalea sp.]|nr:TolC family protein [Flavitalea sp.]